MAIPLGRYLVAIAFALLWPTWLLAAAPNCVDANKVEVHDSNTGTAYSVAYATPSPCVNCITFWGIGGRSLADRTMTSVQMGGQNMTLIESRQNTGQAIGALYYIVAPPSGTNNLTATIGAGGLTGRDMVIWTCSGVDQVSPLGDTGVATGLSTGPSVTLTPVDSTQTVVDYMTSDDAGALSAGANQTIIHEGNSGSAVGAASYQAGADGGVMSWALGGSDDWVTIGAVLNAASTGRSRGVILFE